jgi:hypothetical protein
VDGLTVVDAAVAVCASVLVAGWGTGPLVVVAAGQVVVPGAAGVAW